MTQPLNGISEYTHFLDDVYMPKGKEACQFCDHCKRDYDLDLRRCAYTGEFLLFYKTQLGESCPLREKK